MVNITLTKKLEVKINADEILPQCKNSYSEKTEFTSGAKDTGEKGLLHIAGRNVN